jgi:hypothetical protein
VVVADPVVVGWALVTEVRHLEMSYVAQVGTRTYGPGLGSSHQPANLGDILERVLDKGLVIAGDIQVNLLDIELLTIKLRLVIASLETAREVGINWWEHDPWLISREREAQLAREIAGSRRDLELMEAEAERLRTQAATVEERPTGSERGGDRRRARDRDGG